MLWTRRPEDQGRRRCRSQSSAAALRRPREGGQTESRQPKVDPSAAGPLLGASPIPGRERETGQAGPHTGSCTPRGRKIWGEARIFRRARQGHRGKGRDKHGKSSPQPLSAALLTPPRGPPGCSHSCPHPRPVQHLHTGPGYGQPPRNTGSLPSGHCCEPTCPPPYGSPGPAHCQAATPGAASMLFDSSCPWKAHATHCGPLPGHQGLSP